MIVGLALLAALSLLALSCAFETAFFSAARAKFVTAPKESPAARVLAVLRKPDDFITTTLVAINLAHASFACLVAFLLNDTRHPALYATLVAAPITILFGELLPKSYARARRHSLLLRWIPLYLALARLLRPVAFPISRFAHVVAERFFPTKGFLEGRREERKSLESLLHAAQEGGDLDGLEAERAFALLDLRGGILREMMVSRVDVTMFPSHVTREEILAAAARTGISRYPLHAGTPDEIVGVVHYLDCLRDPARAPRDLARAPLFLPELAGQSAALAAIRRTGSHMAIVVDGWVGTAGIVTLELLVERVVGAISDEAEWDPVLVRPEGNGIYLLDGGADLEEVERLTGRELDEGGVETVGGFLTRRLDGIPPPGASVEVGGHTLTILQSDARRVALVRLAPRRGYSETP